MSEFASATTSAGAAAEKEVVLISGDNEEFRVPAKVATMSAFVKSMLEGDEESDEEKKVPLPNVKTPILAKVLEFAKHYQTEPMTEFVKVSNRYACFRRFSMIINIWVCFLAATARS